MGEYATRKSDGQQIKIGTCESMYYLRLEDKDKVIPEEGSGFGWFYRLPFPDEDHLMPGEYDDYKRGERLYNNKNEDFSLGDDTEAGSLQLRHECGLLLSIPCYHGARLPQITSEKYKTHYSCGEERTASAAWNGKSWFLELQHIKEIKGETWPVVGCRFCQQMWRFDWADVLPYLNGEMRIRLEPYALAAIK